MWGYRHNKNPNIAEWVSILKGLEIAELKEEDMPMVYPILLDLLLLQGSHKSWIFL